MIGRIVLALAATAIAPGSPPIERPSVTVQGPIIVQLDAVPFSALVVMLVRDVIKLPFSVSPEVLADRRPMSVRLAIPRDAAPAFVEQYLRSQGLTVRRVGGSILVSKSASSSGSWGASSSTSSWAAPSGSSFGSVFAASAQVPPVETYQTGPNSQPPAAPGQAAVDQNGSNSGRIGPSPAAFSGRPELALYLPSHRQPAYLAELLRSAFPSLVVGQRAQLRPSSDGASIDPREDADVLLISGSRDDVSAACDLIVLLDRERPMVAVRAVVMQVQNDKARGSALSVFAKLAGGDVSVSSFALEPLARQFVRLSAGAVSAAFSVVRQDTRFKVVATPNLVALSGAVATLNSGAQVPTIGAVVAGDNGPPVQSVTYRDSGITLTVRPVVRGDVIEMEVKEERSTFTRTTTGVEASPTLQRSSVTAQVVIKSGESVALAGLTENTESARNDGIFGGWLGVREKNKNDSELVIVLSAEIVAAPSAPPGRFLKRPAVLGALLVDKTPRPKAD